MPKLLFLCHTLPYPPDGGVFIRSYHVLRQLSRRFDVTALCFQRSGARDHDVEQAVQKLSEFAPTQAFPIPQNERIVRKGWDHTRSLVKGRVFTFYKHTSKPFEKRLMELLNTKRFDLVHVDSLDLCAHLPLLGGNSVVCGHHNVESQLLRRRAEIEANPLKRWYLTHQARLQQEEEKYWCDRVALNVTVSEEDRSTLRTIVPGATTSVIPNGVDVEYFSPSYSDASSDVNRNAPDIVFVGGAGWFPNRDGMEFFCEEMLPRLRERLGSVTVRWVGAAGNRIRHRFEEEYGIQMTGFVDDVRPHLGPADCFVVPLRVGGGSRLKILDAWAMGKAVVSTAQGCEGLDARDEVNILVRDDPGAFVEAVVRVIQRDEVRRRLGRTARDTVVDSYSWEIIGEKMSGIYADLISNNSANPKHPSDVSRAN